MELNKIYTRTTWNDAAEAINTNNLKINQAIEELRRQSGVAGDGSVTTEKIADGAVTNTKIYSRAVTTDKIAEKAVKAEHIASNTITEEHLSQALRDKINDDAGYVWAFKLENEVSQVAEATTQPKTTVYKRI